MCVYICIYELTYKVWKASVIFQTSKKEASFTVEVRPLMGLVKKRLPRERQRTNCSSNIEIIKTLIMFFSLKNEIGF